MSQPVPVPSCVFDGLRVVLGAEACFMSLNSYVACAMERGLYVTARWIASHPHDFGQGLLYGFTLCDPDEIAIPATGSPGARYPAAA